MGARNETRLRRWESRVVVAAVVVIAVQVVAVLVLDRTAELVVVWALWPTLMLGGLVTVPVDSARGAPPSLRFLAATVLMTTGGFVVPQLALSWSPDAASGADVWWLVGATTVTVVGGLLVGAAVLLMRRRWYRRGPQRTVALRISAPSDGGRETE